MTSFLCETVGYIQKLHNDNMSLTVQDNIVIFQLPNTKQMQINEICLGLK